METNQPPRPIGPREYVSALLFPAYSDMPKLFGLPLRQILVHNIPCWSFFPEKFMNYIASIGSSAWKTTPIRRLDEMSKDFNDPYLVFYPVVSRDGMPFPINKSIQGIQGKAYSEEYAWRGDILVIKSDGSIGTNPCDISMADFPIIKNWFLTHGCV